MFDKENYIKTLNDSVKSINARLGDFKVQLAIVLGSGLGKFASLCECIEIIKYSEINGFPTSSVEGHSGELIFGKIAGVNVVLMSGRVHMYEGYSTQQTVMPIRLMGLLGAKQIVLTNAAGGINKAFKVGDLMIIKDHISMFVPSPLIGKNIDSLGVRFPDMSEVYNKNLCKELNSIAVEKNIDLKEGIYTQVSGPQYETPAEITLCRLLGGDAVGMSTVVEAIAARHMGMKVCGISCITNMAAGVEDVKLSHSEVSKAANDAFPKFSNLLIGLLERLALAE